MLDSPEMIVKKTGVCSQWTTENAFKSKMIDFIFLTTKAELSTYNLITIKRITKKRELSFLMLLS